MLVEVTKIFEERKLSLSNLESTYYKEIPREKLKNAKNSHGLDHTDTVLLLIDHTFLGSATDSTLFTDTGISIYHADHDAEVFIPYEDISKVEYKDGNFILFLESGIEHSVDDCFFFYNSDQVNGYKFVFIEIINKLATLFVNKDSLYATELDKYIEEENHSKIIEFTTEYLEQNEDEGDYSLVSYYQKANSLLETDKIEEAFDNIEIAEDLCNNEHPLFSDILLLRASISEEKKDFEDSIRCILICKNINTDKKNQKILNELFTKIYPEYTASFVNLDKDEKKIIFISDNLNFISNNYKSFLRKELPGVEFPVGHPIDDQFYLTHPILENKYIPLQNFENILFRDKVRELSILLQCLGAKSITIESEKGSSLESIANSTINFKAEANVKIHSGKASKDSKLDSENISKELNQLSTTQKFSPTKKPYLPDSLIWFNQEPEWQQIYQQRMNGNLDSYSIVLKNQFSHFNKENEFKKINAEYENFVVKVGADFTKNISNQFKAEGYTQWKIKVDFAPFSELKEENQRKDSISQSTLKKEEDDYIDFFKDAFEDEGISPDERKLLDKKRDKLNISPQRADELEKIAIKSILNLPSKKRNILIC